MNSGSNGEEPTSWEELYNINLIPSELFLKFRKEIEGIRVGFNLEVLLGFSAFFLLAKRQYMFENGIIWDITWFFYAMFLIYVVNDQ